MDKIKGFLKGLRDAVAFSFSWLTICVIIVSLLSGNKIVTVSFLTKLFLLCLWGSISFTLCFRNQRFAKKGFMFSLTAFYILFIPVEIVMFYLMGIFSQAGSPGLWMMFGGIVVIMYLVSAIIDKVIMRRRSELYTEKLTAYNKLKD
ncbi:hypothetical protein SAMN02910369_01054 [Lachnospiraceae bacterium NE2001]|nr:hypothetical protein SAMN02910369_01054 [Lachnospiraceae bacterium NE2001]